MTDKELIRAEIDKRYAEYRAKMKTDNFTYYEGMADALDLFEQFLDTLPEQPVTDCHDLEEEIRRWIHAQRNNGRKVFGWIDMVELAARHFAEWGAEHGKK